MNALLQQLKALLAERSPRERWILVIASCVFALWAVDGLIVTPLEERIERSTLDFANAEADTLRAGRLAQRIFVLRGELETVQRRIQPGAETNLLALIESLAHKAGMKDQLEAIKPRLASGNALYPETRVEVSLKGATLQQTVELLYAIEHAPLHLLVRSLRIRSRKDWVTQVLDVSFFVSSFERA